jgi:VanZ family protein
VKDDRVMSEQFISWIPPLGWMLVIHMVSGVSGSELPDGPFPHFDKVIHFGVYALLSLLFFRAFCGMEKWRPWTCVLFCVLLTSGYGGWDEMRQASVIGRASDEWDLLLDVAGACVVAILPVLMKYKPEWYQWLK